MPPCRPCTGRQPRLGSWRRVDFTLALLLDNLTWNWHQSRISANLPARRAETKNISKIYCHLEHAACAGQKRHCQYRNNAPRGADRVRSKTTTLGGHFSAGNRDCVESESAVCILADTSQARRVIMRASLIDLQPRATTSEAVNCRAIVWMEEKGGWGEW